MNGAITKGVELVLFLFLMPLASCTTPFNDENDSPLSLSGTLEAREVELGFQASGRILHLNVDEGHWVKKGDLIAVLDERDYALAQQRARAEAEATRMALAALRAGTRSQELRVAEAAVAQARAELDFARSEARRIRRLFDQKLVAEEQLEQAQLRVAVAAQVLKKAQQQLHLLREGPRSEDIQRAEAEYEARKTALAIAEQNLAYARLHSPVDGVVSVRMAEKGQFVAIGQPVMKVSDLTHPWVRAFLKETDLPRVRLGQEVTVSVDGVDRTFRGRLSFISPEAEFTPKTVETKALRVDLVYRIKVDVPNPDGILKIGMPADLVIPVQQ